MSEGREDEGAGAEPGEGPGGAPRRPPSPKRKRRPSSTAYVDDGLQRLIQTIGREKLAPDVSAQEVYYSRSLRIRRLVAEFLVESEGTTWANLPELHARAANYAGCSSVTAARWIHQFTRVGARHRLVEAVDHWLLERRE